MTNRHLKISDIANGDWHARNPVPSVVAEVRKAEPPETVGDGIWKQDVHLVGGDGTTMVLAIWHQPLQMQDEMNGCKVVLECGANSRGLTVSEYEGKKGLSLNSNGRWYRPVARNSTPPQPTPPPEDAPPDSATPPPAESVPSGGGSPSDEAIGILRDAAVRIRKIIDAVVRTQNAIVHAETQVFGTVPKTPDAKAWEYSTKRGRICDLSQHDRVAWIASRLGYQADRADADPVRVEECSVAVICQRHYAIPWMDLWNAFSTRPLEKHGRTRVQEIFNRIGTDLGITEDEALAKAIMLDKGTFDDMLKS